MDAMISQKGIVYTLQGLKTNLKNSIDALSLLNSFWMKHGDTEQNKFNVQESNHWVDN